MKTVDIRPDGPMEETLLFAVSVMGIIVAFGIAYFGLNLLYLEWDGLQISVAALTVLLAQVISLFCFIALIETISIWLKRIERQKDDKK